MGLVLRRPARLPHVRSRAGRPRLRHLPRAGPLQRHARTRRTARARPGASVAPHRRRALCRQGRRLHQRELPLRLLRPPRHRLSRLRQGVPPLRGRRTGARLSGLGGGRPDALRAHAPREVLPDPQERRRRPIRQPGTLRVPRRPFHGRLPGRREDVRPRVAVSHRAAAPRRRRSLRAGSAQDLARSGRGRRLHGDVQDRRPQKRHRRLRLRRAAAPLHLSPRRSGCRATTSTARSTTAS